MEKLLYRINEVMESLAISRRKIYQLIKEGELTEHNDNPGHKGVRITVESVKAYFEKYQRKKR